ncbi:MAG: hypothetical protein EOP06_00140 [Proteobacteria bacterium]|nr:MAG: hypothetical protein EOP06_00140 [Pseudomonadota bacterium]
MGAELIINEEATGDACSLIYLAGYEVLVDSEDVARLQNQNWSVQRGEGARLTFQTRARVDGRLIRMTLQRFLMRPSGADVASKRQGFDRLDYRKEALIIADMTEIKCRMAKTDRQMTSKYKGVSRCKNNGRWRASIRPQGMSFYLGEFECEREAARAYNRAALHYFGENAFQNEVD